MCLRYILSDNGTEFKNNLMDQVLKQLSIEWIFPAPYHPQEQWQIGSFSQILKTNLEETL